MWQHWQRIIKEEAEKYGYGQKPLNESPALMGGEGSPTMFGWSKHQFESKFRELMKKMGYERGIVHMASVRDASNDMMKIYFSNAPKARDFVTTFNGMVRRASKGAVASVATEFNKMKVPTGTVAIVTLDLNMVKGESFAASGESLFEWFEQNITEGAVKAAMEDWVEGLPKAVVAEISRKYGAKLKAAEMNGLSKTDPVRKELKQLLDKNKVAPAMGDKSRESDIAALEMMFNTFHGESVEVNEENLNIGTYGFRIDRDSGKFVLYQLSYSQGSVRFPDGRKGTVIGRYATRDEAIAAAKRQAGVKEEVEVAEQFKTGDKVKVPHKGKMVNGKIVRYDDGGTDKARQHGGGYVVDVGEPASVLVPAHKIVKEEVELDGMAQAANRKKEIKKAKEAEEQARRNYEAEVDKIYDKMAKIFKKKNPQQWSLADEIGGNPTVMRDAMEAADKGSAAREYRKAQETLKKVLAKYKQKVQKEEMTESSHLRTDLTNPKGKAVVDAKGKVIAVYRTERAARKHAETGKPVKEEVEELIEAQQVIGKYRFTSFTEGSLKGWLISVQSKGEVGFIEEPAKKNTRTSIAPHKVFFNTKQQGNPKLVLTAFPDSTTRFVGDKEVRFAPRQLLKAVAMWMDKYGMSMVEETEIMEVWWKGTDSLTKTDADGLIDDLEKAYKKGGLNGTMKVPNGDSGPVWEMIDGLTDFLRGEPKNMVAYVLKGVHEFLKPEDRNNSKIKAVFESLDEEGETISEDEWGGGFQSAADAHRGVQAGLKADFQRERAQKLKLIVQVIRGEISKQKFKKLTGSNYDELMKNSPYFRNQIKRMPKKALEPVAKAEDVEVDEAYAPLDTKGIVGAFTEATQKKRFEYRNSTDSWGKSHGLPHEVCVSYGGDRKEQWRAANVKGTVCYIAVDEGADGKPVMEKWAIRNHVKYVKAEQVDSQEISWKTIYEGAVEDAQALAKEIKAKARELGVEISVGGSTSISFYKKFTPGNKEEFFKAYSDCDKVRRMVRFKSRVNEWGASTGGLGLGAQDDIKRGMVQIHKSGDGAAYLLKAIDKAR